MRRRARSLLVVGINYAREPTATALNTTWLAQTLGELDLKPAKLEEREVTDVVTAVRRSLAP